MTGLGAGTLLGTPPVIKIKDGRKVDAASKLPITDRNRKDVNVNPDYAKRIVREAKSQGVDPYTALAMAHQESNLSEDDENPFKLYGGGKTDDPVKEGISFLKDKLNYAAKLGKKTEPEQIQAYNGYGKITAKSEDKSNKYYGIDVSKNPIDMNKTPLYGQRVIDLRDNVLKKNQDIVKLVDSVPDNDPKLTAPLAQQPNQGLFTTQLLGLK